MIVDWVLLPATGISGLRVSAVERPDTVLWRVVDAGLRARVWAPRLWHTVTTDGLLDMPCDPSGPPLRSVLVGGKTPASTVFGHRVSGGGWWKAVDRRVRVVKKAPDHRRLNLYTQLKEES